MAGVRSCRRRPAKPLAGFGASNYPTRLGGSTRSVGIRAGGGGTRRRSSAKARARSRERAMSGQAIRASSRRRSSAGGRASCGRMIQLVTLYAGLHRGRIDIDRLRRTLVACHCRGPPMGRWAWPRMSACICGRTRIAPQPPRSDGGGGSKAGAARAGFPDDRISARAVEAVGKGALACLEVGRPVGGGSAAPLDGRDQVEAEYRAGDRGPEAARGGHQGCEPGAPVGDVMGGQASAEGGGRDVGAGQVAGEQPAGRGVRGPALGSGVVGQGCGQRDRGRPRARCRAAVLVGTCFAVAALRAESATRRGLRGQSGPSLVGGAPYW